MMNPLEKYFLLKEAAIEQRKQHELDLWQRWKSEGKKPEHLQPLLKLYEPVFAQKTRQWKAKFVPESAFKAELQSHFIKALDTYDPSRGAAINTHVETRLKKARRFNNRYANLLYIPEGQAENIGKIQKAKDELSEDLGREPTTSEIADHLGMPPKRVDTIMKAVKRDIPMSHSGGAETPYDYTAGGDTSTGRGFETQQIAVAQNILPEIFPKDQGMHDLFHFTFGTGGHPQITSTGELAKKLGKSPSQISRMKTVMGNTLRKHMGLDEPTK